MTLYLVRTRPDSAPYLDLVVPVHAATKERARVCGRVMGELWADEVAEIVQDAWDKMISEQENHDA